MINDYILNELKKDESSKEQFKEELKVRQTMWSEELKNGLGEDIKKDIEMMQKPTFKQKIILFFNRILNTL